MLIDSHCHINDPLYLNKAGDYVKEALENNVQIMVVVGYDLKSSIDAVNIANRFTSVYAIVGIIPNEVKNMGENDLESIENLIKNNKKVIGVGEIGLDYYWEKDDKLKMSQKEMFIKQIKLANKYNLPVSIHCRDAYEDCYKILKEHRIKNKGIIHCYSGSKEMAELFIKLGYKLGIGGTCTFKNAIKIKDVVKNISDNDYVLETDAPYLTPVPHRGEANHSKYLSFIRDEIANLRNISSEKVENDSSKNFLDVFKLWKKLLMPY